MEPIAIFNEQSNPYSDERFDGVQETYEVFSHWEDSVTRKLEVEIAGLPRMLPGLPGEEPPHQPRALARKALEEELEIRRAELLLELGSPDWD